MIPRIGVSISNISCGMDLSIIIVNWNSVGYLRNCLRSIYGQNRGLVFEIIVVDNASYDGCGEFLEREFPSVKFIQSAENVGFSRANNLGAQYAAGRVLLFLNPDTEIVGSAIELMFSQLSALPDAGAMGCKLIRPDLSLQMSSIRRYPTILNQALAFDSLMRIFPMWKLWGMMPLFNTGNPIEAVEVIPGACIMVKKKIFEEAGRFSTDYFMYGEDVDLSYKINKADYKIYYVGAAKIIHHGGGSSKTKKENNFSDVLIRESRLKFFEKNRGGSYAAVYRISTVVVSAICLLCIAVLMPSVLLYKESSLSSAFRKWKSIFRWSVGLEKWARELTCNGKSV